MVFGQALPRRQFVLLTPNPGPCIICPKTISSPLGSTTFEYQNSQKVDVSSELDSHQLYHQWMLRAHPPPPLPPTSCPLILQLGQAPPCSPHLPASRVQRWSAQSREAGRLLHSKTVSELSHLLGSMLERLNQVIRVSVPTMPITRITKVSPLL